MPENEFEKQVQKKLEDFGIKPSEEVWNYVEPRIQIKRRRRWLVIPMLLLLIAVAGSYFIYVQKYNGDTKKPVGASAQNTIPIKENEANKNISSNSNTTTVTEKQTDAGLSRQDQVVAQNQLNKNGIKKPVVAIKNSLEKSLLQQNLQPLNKEHVNDQVKTLIQNNDNVSKPIVTKDEHLNTENIGQLPKEENTEQEITAKKDDPVIAAETKEDRPEAAIENKSLSAKNDIHIPVQTFSKKIQWGFSAFYGRTNVWENFAGIGIGNNSLALEYSLSPGSIGVSYFNSNAAKNVQPKSAWSAGLQLKKQISPRSSFISGINFTYLKTGMETGIMASFGDTTFSYNNIAPQARVENIFKTGSGNVYTNNFYLLQVPLLYEYKLGILKNTPLYANAGLSANALLSTNMILYDSYNLAFYNNNQLLNKFLVNMHLGMNMQILQSKNTVIMLGPQMQYSLTNLLKNKNYGQQHMVQYGLKASLFLK